jgi:2-polyprenyl-3-methyl-5-hydroxy-6-metoxy-1,4-benzoquinol methylase
MFDQLLAHEWRSAIPSVKARLTSDPPARVADIACGEGRSSLAIARGYPKVTVDGLDLDEASIKKAGANVTGSGLEDRVRFHCRDAADPQLSGAYDLVLIFESLHDMTHPVDALNAAREMLGPLHDVGAVRSDPTMRARLEPRPPGHRLRRERGRRRAADPAPRLLGRRWQGHR